MHSLKNVILYCDFLSFCLQISKFPRKENEISDNFFSLLGISLKSKILAHVICHP